MYQFANVTLTLRYIKKLKERKLTLTTTVTIPKQKVYLTSFKTRLTQMNRKNEDPGTFLDLLEAFILLMIQ